MGPQEAVFSRRTFLAYQLEQSNGAKITLVPVHLMEPWMALLREHGKMSTGYEIFMNNENPLYEQTKRLILYAQAEQTRWNVPLLMLGDFNLPKSSFKSGYLNSMGYDLIAEFFTDLFREDSTPTFPTATSLENDTPEMPMLQLDHAFLLGNVPLSDLDYAHSPRLMGSDHYPIWVKLELP
jgi:endonuclease/exonuclease/phosphatase family metal-dependent hydrolase